MGKKKIELTPEINVDVLLKKMEKEYQDKEISTIDGVKIDFEERSIYKNPIQNRLFVFILRQNLSKKQMMNRFNDSKDQKFDLIIIYNI